MDVLNVTEEITLKNVEVKQVIPIRTDITKDYIITVYVFMDENTNTYYHISSTGTYKFHVGERYDIKCIYDKTRNNKIKYIKDYKLRKNPVHNEQDKPDALDVLLGLARYQ